MSLHILQRDKFGLEKNFDILPYKWIELNDWEYFVYEVWNDHAKWKYTPRWQYIFRVMTILKLLDSGHF